MSNSREVHMAFIERRGKYKSYMRSGISIFSTIYIYAHRFPCTYLSSYEPFFKLREYNTLYHVISSLKNFFTLPENSVYNSAGTVILIHTSLLLKMYLQTVTSVLVRYKSPVSERYTDFLAFCR